MTGQYLPILYIIGQYLPRTTPKARIMSRVEEEKAAKMRPNTNNRFPMCQIKFLLMPGGCGGMERRMLNCADAFVLGIFLY